MEGNKVEEFELGEPVLVCRWRLAGGKLPLENRHLRALSRRVVLGRAVTPQLVGWAKQHIEWTLQDGSAENPDGVLMLVMDAEGRAAMSVGPYAPLANEGQVDGGVPVEKLAERAAASECEATEAGIAPETLWAAGPDGALVAGFAEDAPKSGAASLVADLAATFGMKVRYEDDLASRAAAGAEGLGEVFLVSDEHGIVPAADAKGETGARFASAYAKLLDATRDAR